jgi:methenyltetrahydrofolate cyclohydrolase
VTTTVNENGNRLVDLPVTGFNDALASGEAAPGGGSAAALAGALGAALAAMVGRLTVGRAQYAEHHNAMTDIVARADVLRSELLAQIDADTAAYTQVMEAYRLPKADAEDKAARTAAIQAALCHAAEIPLATARACVSVLELAVTACRDGNRNASSDGVVAALMAQAALEGAARNVRINLASIKDAAYCAEMGRQVEDLSARGRHLLAEAIAAADAA